MRVVGCFAFLDRCGSTAFTTGRGDAAAVAELSRLRAAVRAHAGQSGVRVTKRLGDRAMLSGMKPAAVVACAATIFAALGGQRAAAAGRRRASIMFEGDDYIGAPVNTAARLCDAAPAGQMLMSADTVAAAGIPSAGHRLIWLRHPVRPMCCRRTRSPLTLPQTCRPATRHPPVGH